MRGPVSEQNNTGAQFGQLKILRMHRREFAFPSLKLRNHVRPGIPDPRTSELLECRMQQRLQTRRVASRLRPMQFRFEVLQCSQQVVRYSVLSKSSAIMYNSACAAEAFTGTCYVFFSRRMRSIRLSGTTHMSATKTYIAIETRGAGNARKIAIV